MVYGASKEYAALWEWRNQDVFLTLPKDLQESHSVGAFILSFFQTGIGVSRETLFLVKLDRMI